MQDKDTDDANKSNPTGDVSGTPRERSAASRLRLLDFDDLFLLSHLLAGSTIAATARQLGLTQPAITQRVRKIERVFDDAILEKAGRHVRLTAVGRAICLKAADALALMRDVSANPTEQALNLGVATTFGAGWLWPALAALHAEQPDRLYHCTEGGREELRLALESGAIDACLTVAEAAPGAFGVLPIREAEFLAVASPELAAKIAVPEAAADHLFLDLDRSMPLYGRVPAAWRSRLRFRDVWYLGSTGSLMAAALAGHGVAVLPLATTFAAMQAGKLVPVLGGLDCVPVKFVLAFRRDRQIEAMAKLLAERLIQDSAKGGGAD